MTPKLTYVLNGQTKTITFNPADYVSFQQEWEKDEIEFKHPFNGDKTRKNRGYYYKATIAFDAIPYDLIDDYRDLFNKATSTIMFYPNSQEIERYEVDVNELISAEDEHVALAYRNVELIFRSKQRFDSALNYPQVYWGARRTAFQDDPALETHRSQLQAADNTNRDSVNTIESTAAAHLSSGHAALYYTKSELTDVKLDGLVSYHSYGFAGDSYIGEPYIRNESGGFYDEAGMFRSTGSVVVGTGSITKISTWAKAGITTLTKNFNVAINVNVGQVLQITTKWTYQVQGAYTMYFVLLIDGVEVWAGDSIVTQDNPGNVQLSCMLLEQIELGLN